ncbi:hypothetical protein [Corallococcus sp. CA047B]|uniref:hypothetical protein n=1 Tax=Corallococcus sp. CA047B TaxID=2316729 RepID=UPI0011C44BC0|nr:hypothetical protein [Corallococcus sp. CA047B]
MVLKLMAEAHPVTRLPLIGIHKGRVATRQEALKEHVELVVALQLLRDRSGLAANLEALSHLQSQEWPAADYLDEKLLLDAMVAAYRSLQRGTEAPASD